MIDTKEQTTMALCNDRQLCIHNHAQKMKSGGAWSKRDKTNELGTKQRVWSTAEKSVEHLLTKYLPCK